jgi:hypothetical protein
MQLCQTGAAQPIDSEAIKTKSSYFVTKSQNGHQPNLQKAPNQNGLATFSSALGSKIELTTLTLPKTSDAEAQYVILAA